MRRDSWILAIGLASIYAGCGGPTEPDCVSGGAEACWTSIGPPGQWVTALAHTPWGLLAGTRDGGVFLRDPANGEWRALGLDHAAVSALVVVPGSPDRVLVGMRPRTMERTPAAIFASQDTGRT